MRKRRSGDVFNIVFVLGMAATLAACSHAQAVTGPPAAEAAAGPSAPLPVIAEAAAPPAPMTREKASTECWMKYEKEARGLSLDQRLPLVEKCTAEKLKPARR
ncbi:MAG TPA: hypothetical protein VFK79_07345 [Xanthobacteraceae bacterium]|nr:hypothetical protein [Xanthobacteraceae bacterium]